MKIIPSASPPDIANVGARQDTAHAQQWRKALEEAQWQARQRIAPAGPAATGAPDAGALPMEAAAVQVAREPGAWRPQAGQAATAAGAARTDALARAIAGATQATRAAPVTQRAPVEAPLAGVTAAAQPPAVAGGRPVAAAPTSAVALWHELPEWPAVMVHASVHGNRISVGMRDGTLRDDDLLELFYRLRAHLRATGLELTALTVNGHNVTPADDAGSRIG